MALAYHKVLDDIADDGALKARAAERLLAGAYERARTRIPEQCAEIERAMAAIRTIEERRAQQRQMALSGGAGTACDSPLSADATDTALAFDPDAAAHEFGRMLGRLFAHNQGSWTEAMEELGRGLGRFIYLMDAAVDFDDDAASGSYNPFVALGSDAEAVRATLALAAADAAAPYERLPLVQDAHLMDAILYSGVWAQFNKSPSAEASCLKRMRHRDLAFYGHIASRNHFLRRAGNAETHGDANKEGTLQQVPSKLSRCAQTARRYLMKAASRLAACL